MSLRVRFWGTRGSIPSPGRSTVRYGGNTPCVELRTSEDRLIILDAGTGIRELGLALTHDRNGASPPVAADIFVTHAHWDHIQGLPFFAPVFERGNRFTIWGARTMATSIGRVVRDQMSPVVFPVAFDELGASIDFRELEAGDECHGAGYTVRATAVRHPGGALGYRFTDHGAPTRALVYISDNELDEDAKYESPAGWRDALVAFVHRAELLVHDATYTAAEYARHRGWGHSTYEDAVRLALDADVGTLALFHHRPERSDDELERRVDDCRAIVTAEGGRLEIVAAAEGLTLDV